jgi:hypothetical protein
MKVICLEDYYLPNNNAFPVCGAKYGEEYLALTKGKIYDLYVDAERTGIYLTCNEVGVSHPIGRYTGSHIQGLEEYRNEKIDDLIS